MGNRDRKPKRPTTKVGLGASVAKAVPPLAGQPKVLAPCRTGDLVVRWTRFDHDGPWPLSASPMEDIVAMFRRVAGFETMRPGEIFRPGSEIGKEYDIDRLSNNLATTRLATLQFNDETRIARLRIDGASRLYGFRRGPEFYAIWWDPKHQIWPSVLRHT